VCLPSAPAMAGRGLPVKPAHMMNTGSVPRPFGRSSP
jgi:hypothetical protein